ncbi:MAG: bifunctional nuclease family protein [Actinobacteria bacterium]|nr:bifunctional nuclease family protein [Actinomycetota bacterium]NBY15784.1 bifunctional nuclease family protein [Actinomycetota bacterium]
MVQVEVVGVRIEFPSNQPVLILREIDSPRFLPLWIGMPEASAISMALDGVAVSRPMTHDLLLNVITDFSEKLVSVEVTELQDGVFYAVLQFSTHDAVSARPSDAVALAIRADVPIYVSDDVMATAGQFVSEQEQESDTDTELEQFREFLDQIKPEDFS